MQLKITKPIAELRTSAAARVDVLAGETRLKYITTSPGQEATYTAKLTDARAYIAAGYPVDDTPYIWIKTEAERTGATSSAVANLVSATAQAWSLVGAQIEGSRQSAKQAILAAADAGAIYAAEQTFKTAMQLL